MTKEEAKEATKDLMNLFDLDQTNAGADKKNMSLRELRSETRLMKDKQK